MNKKLQVIKQGMSAALEAAPFVVELFDPEIATNPHVVVARVGQKIAAHFLSRFADEFAAKVESKELKADAFATEKPALMLRDVLKIIDEGELDEERFQAIKSIFFAGIAVAATKEDELHAYEFLRTANKVSGTEILILSANYAIAEGHANDEAKLRLQKLTLNWSREAWRKIIAAQMGQDNFDAVVGKYESNLESLGLISRRQERNEFADEFVPVPVASFRLTEFGRKFCRFMDA
jgi:hypothetical protein